MRIFVLAASGLPLFGKGNMFMQVLIILSFCFFIHSIHRATQKPQGEKNVSMGRIDTLCYRRISNP